MCEKAAVVHLAGLTVRSKLAYQNVGTPIYQPLVCFWSVKYGFTRGGCWVEC